MTSPGARAAPSRRALVTGAVALGAAPALAGGRSRLKDLAGGAGRLFGTALEPAVFDADADFAALVRRECDLLIPENAMKWNALRPTPDGFDFGQADRLVAIAREMGAAVHGHCLVWHEALPGWFAPDLAATRAAALLEGHMRTVVGRYAGRLRSWDVVNEAIERNDRRPDGLRRSPWLGALGPGYLELAFRLAHAADPAARLALSDYGLEYDNVGWMVEKRGAMLETLARLKRAGAPIHALSIQGHLEASRPAGFGDGLRTFLRRVAGLGLEIYITELDVNEASLTGPAAERDRIVGDLYARFLDVALDEPAVSLVATWGLTDRHTSKTAMFPHADGADVRPLPFDAALRPKPAALALARAFRAARPRVRPRPA